jgi:hypothetical protein
LGRTVGFEIRLDDDGVDEEFSKRDEPRTRLLLETMPLVVISGSITGETVGDEVDDVEGIIGEGITEFLRFEMEVFPVERRTF